MLRKVFKLLAGVLALLVVSLAGLVAYASATHEGRIRHPDTPYPKLAASSDPDLIARGRYLVHGPAHCSQCHSTADREHPEQINAVPLQGGLEFAMGPIATTWAPNLTPDKETGIGRRSDEELARVIRTGVLPDGSYSIFMGLAAAKPSDEDLVAILSYLRSMEPVRNEVEPGEWYAGGKLMLLMLTLSPGEVAGPAHVPEAAEPTVERGEYLANHVMLCVACHSEVDQATFRPVGPKAGGGLPEASHGSDTDMEYVTPNLTSDPTGVTGRLDEDAFVARLRGGRVYATSTMPWENFALAADSDLRSVYRYLKSLPPVQNDVGPSYRKAGWKPGEGS